MGFYKQFNLYSWQYKVGFGGRVQPTKRRGGPRPASMVPPLTAVEPSRLVDEDAEAVKAKAQEELKEESELQRMSAFDKPQEILREVEFGDGRILRRKLKGHCLWHMRLNLCWILQAVPGQAMSSVQVQQDWQFSQQQVLRTHDDEDAVDMSEAKRSKVEDFKKQRINRLAADQEQFIRTVAGHEGLGGIIQLQWRSEKPPATKFVKDWRKKLYVSLDGQSRERWMRRSRLVARENANTKRDDTFSPATGAHTSNLLPVYFIDLKAQSEGCDECYKPFLASLDIKDAFLQVPQEQPIETSLRGSTYVILKNLPRHRRGSKMWYDHCRGFLEQLRSVEFCVEQPCLARSAGGVVLIHVGNLLFAGSQAYFHEHFLKTCKQDFVVNVSELAGSGTSISCLKKRLISVDGGILIAPGTPVQKIIDSFEQAFGAVRCQLIPCDSSILLEVPECGRQQPLQVPTMFNLADVGTKPLSKKRLLALMGDSGMVFVESQEPVGEAARAELQAHGTTSRSMSKLAKTILRLTLMMGLEPIIANGQGDSCPVENRDASDNFWIGVTMFALVFSWLVLGATAFWFWKKLDKRLHWNELQQAETDTFLGNQRDAVDAVRIGLETFSTRLEGHVQDFQAYVEQTSSEVSVLEDCIDTLRYGMVELGGFVRHRELTTSK
eukprot:s2858_g6.t1